MRKRASSGWSQICRLLGLPERPETLLPDWMRSPRSGAHVERAPPPEAAKPPGRVMAGKYLLLYRYLAGRYADTVVLTFDEIEDLLGFALPDQARLHQAWWTDAALDVGVPNHTDSWILASRTAIPNMMARTVAFERAL